MKSFIKQFVLIVLHCSCFLTRAQMNNSKILYDTIDVSGLQYEFIELEDGFSYVIRVFDTKDNKKLVFNEKSYDFISTSDLNRLFVDYNFDGYIDILNEVDGSPKMYFYNSNSNNFEYQPFLSTLSESLVDLENKSVIFTYNINSKNWSEEKRNSYIIFSGVEYSEGIEVTFKYNVNKGFHESQINTINLLNEKKTKVDNENLAKKYFDKISQLPKNLTVKWKNYTLHQRTISESPFESIPGVYEIEFILKKDGVENDSLSLTTEFNIFKMSENDRVFFILDDFNFDGYPDLRFHNEYDKNLYDHYEYSQSEQNFIFNELFSSYTSIEIDPAKKRIIGTSHYFDYSFSPIKHQVDTLYFNKKAADFNIFYWKNYQLKQKMLQIENENFVSLELINSLKPQKNITKINVSFSNLFSPIIQFEDFNFDGIPEFNIKRNKKTEFYFYNPENNQFEYKSFFNDFDTVIVLPQFKTLRCEKHTLSSKTVVVLQNKNLDFADVYITNYYEEKPIHNYFNVKNDSLFPIHKNGFNVEGNRLYKFYDSLKIEMTFEKVYNFYPGKDTPFQIPINIPFTCKLIYMKTNQDVFKMNYYNTTHLSKMTYDSLMRTQVNQFENDIEQILIDQNKEELYNAPYYFELESPYFLNNKIDKPTYNDFKVYSKETDSIIFSGTVRLFDVFNGRYSNIKIADFNFDSYPDFYIETDESEKSGYFIYDENTSSFYRDSLLNLSLLNTISINFDEKKIVIETPEKIGKKQYRYLLSGKNLQHVKISTYNVLTINVKNFEKEKNFYYDGKTLKDEKLNPNYIDPRYNIQEGDGR